MYSTTYFPSLESIDYQIQYSAFQYFLIQLFVELINFKMWYFDFDSRGNL